jgi:hypothetical protein
VCVSFGDWLGTKADLGRARYCVRRSETSCFISSLVSWDREKLCLMLLGVTFKVSQNVSDEDELNLRRSRSMSRW